jgi:hypothetical protein
LVAGDSNPRPPGYESGARVGGFFFDLEMLQDYAVAGMRLDGALWISNPPQSPHSRDTSLVCGAGGPLSPSATLQPCNRATRRGYHSRHPPRAMGPPRGRLSGGSLLPDSAERQMRATRSPPWHPPEDANALRTLSPPLRIAQDSGAPLPGRPRRSPAAARGRHPRRAPALAHLRRHALLAAARDLRLGGSPLTGPAYPPPHRR